MTNRMFVVLLAGLVMAIGGGCVKNSDIVKAAGVSSRQDAFQILNEISTIPPGYADVKLTASFKLHEPGVYPLESVKTHGAPDYTLIVNIGGQAAVLRGETRGENLSHLSGAGSESGEGIRYNFDRLLRMKAGRHKLVIALPDDAVALEHEIEVVEGSLNILAITPVYGGKTMWPRPWEIDKTHFSRGIAGIRVSLAPFRDQE